MKKELKRIKTNYDIETLDIVNNLDGPEWEGVPFSIKIERLIKIALAYKPYWVEDKVLLVIEGESVEG